MMLSQRISLYFSFLARNLFHLFYFILSKTHSSISHYLTLSALGGAGPSITWGGSIWPALFISFPGAYWAIILSISIIIVFKKRINDYLKKNWVNILKICRDIAIFVGKEIFWKILRISFFKLEIIVTPPFLKISSSSFLLTSPFSEYNKILH